METQTGFHPGAALTGLVFIVLGVLFMLDAVDVAEWRYDLLLPGVLIALGVAAIAGAVLRSRET
ncbi:MAG: hypothetical protein AMXMBFR23_22080 [Chloroflexota bacterium]